MIKALSIVLEDGCNLHYDLDFSDQGTLRITNPVVLGKNSGWLALDFCKCPDCNLENQTSPNCPVAEVLAQYACDLADRQSFEKVKVHIIQEDNRELILRDQPFAQMVIGFVASAATPVLTILLLFTTGHIPLLGWGTLWQLIVMSAGGAVATPVVFVLFGWLHRTLVHGRATQSSFRADREIRRGRS